MVETLTPPLGIRANAPTSAFSPAALEAILPSLKVATDRHQITGAALEFLARGFARVIMFVNLHDQLRGHDGRGQDLVVDAIKQARIPTSGESMFADAIARRTPYLGPWPHERPIDKVFAKALGGIEGNVLLLPVTLSGKVPIILFACGSREQGDVSTFIRLSEAISHAIQRLLVRRKSGKAG
jgi:hypothetical protein